MIGSIIIFVVVLILILFVYIEYKNEKKYQEERRQKRQNANREEKKPVIEAKKAPNAKELEEKKAEQKSEPKLTPEPIVPKIKTETIEVTEKPKIVALSLKNYPKFNHSRLLKMGLSEEEAKEFVSELIPQIGAQIPLIKEAIDVSNFHNIERLTHSIKGSSTTVGTGGISDLLVDFNTYLKTGTEAVLIEAYFDQLNHYYKELKEQYT